MQSSKRTMKVTKTSARVNDVEICNECRLSKIRCDGARPQCSYCRTRDRSCQYAIQNPVRHGSFVSDEQQSDVLAKIANLLHGARQDICNILEQEVQTLKQRGVTTPGLDASRRAHCSQDIPSLPAVAAPVETKLLNFAPSEMATMSMLQNARDSTNDATAATSHDGWGEVWHKLRLCEWDDMLQGELAIPLHHTTAAHYLLTWPKISSSIRGIDPSYVRTLESRHHLDTGAKMGMSGVTGAYQTRYNTEGSCLERSQELDISINLSDVLPGASRGTRAIPRLTESRAHELCDGYLNHVQTLQPFLSRSAARTMVQCFITNTKGRNGIIVPTPSEKSRPDLKRKHQESESGVEHAATSHCMSTIELDSSAENALVLLIFALGTSCLDPPQSQCPSFDPSAGGSTRNHNRRAPHSHRTSGVAFFAQAVSILGRRHGKTDLVQIQASLLAALYLAQLSYTYDSWRWVNTASTKWQMLFRRHNREVKSLSNAELLAYWSCLTLESEFLAELDMVPSGISMLEDVIPLPGIGIDEEEVLLQQYFLAHIQIRKIRDRVHSALYNGSQTKRGWAVLKPKDLADQLDGWKRCLPQHLQWADHDLSAASTSAARLRVQYWTTRSMILRPSLKTYLHPKSADGHDRRNIETAKRSALRCVVALRYSVVAFGYLFFTRQSPTVTNIFSLAHEQFGNMMCLLAANAEVPNTTKLSVPNLGFLSSVIAKLLLSRAHLSPTIAQDARILDSMRNSAYKAAEENDTTSG